MATNFPTSLDTFTNPTATDTLDSPPHDQQHANINDAVEALEAKVGVNSSAVTSSHDYILSNGVLPTLNVDSGVLVVDDTNNRVGVNDSTPSYALDVTGDINASADLRIGGTAVGTWATFTPNVQPETGTWTSSTVTAAKYAVVNDVVVGFLYVAISNFGTGSGGTRFDLPVTAAAGQHQIGTGRENALNGYMLNVYSASTTVGQIQFYDNAATAGANYSLSISFAYQAA